MLSEERLKELAGLRGRESLWNRPLINEGVMNSTNAPQRTFKAKKKIVFKCPSSAAGGKQNTVIKSFKGILIYTGIVLSVSIVYFVYANTVYPPTPERETFLSEIGEGFGEVGLWALLFIYARTVLKLALGKTTFLQRILPDDAPRPGASIPLRLLGFLNRTHVYVGIATIAIILLHIALVGMSMKILFFPAVLVLVLWQGLFGLFLTWRYSPKELKKFSYLVHAQFLTGIMIGIFAFFGHLLIDD